MKQPNVNIHNTRPEMLIVAASAAEKFMKEWPDRKSGVRNLVGFSYEGDISFCVWKTKAGNITVFGVHNTN